MLDILHREISSCQSFSEAKGDRLRNLAHLDHEGALTSSTVLYHLTLTPCLGLINVIDHLLSTSKQLRPHFLRDIVDWFPKVLEALPSQVSNQHLF